MTWEVTYHLGAAITVVVEADEVGEATVLARAIADEALADADEVLAEASASVVLIGPAYLADVAEVTP